MIRRNGPKGFLLITQNDHAALAAQIAAHWGNELFAAPDPREAVVTAIECHDAGWSIHDDKPFLNGQKIPASFYEMPVSAYVRVWVASVSAAAARGGPMAGLIVSWHFTGLSRFVPTQGQPEGVQNMLLDFAAAQHHRQEDYCDALHLSRSLANYPPMPLNERDAGAVYNLWVLRMCDWLSLLLCDDALPDALRDAPPVPEGVEAPAITACWKDRRTMCLEPWPLNVARLPVSVAGQRVPAGQYRREVDLIRVYEHSEAETLSYNLMPAG